jgi:hypothetical protein
MRSFSSLNYNTRFFAQPCFLASFLPPGITSRFWSALPAKLLKNRRSSYKIPEKYPEDVAANMVPGISLTNMIITKS